MSKICFYLPDFAADRIDKSRTNSNIPESRGEGHTKHSKSSLEKESIFNWRIGKLFFKRRIFDLDIGK